MNTLSKSKIILLAFTTVILFTASSFAQHLEPSMCIFFENSEKIFLGNFQKQSEKTDGENKKYLVADFSIQQGIKGLEQKKDKITANSVLYAKHLKAGETYLVFLRTDESKLTTYKLAGVFPITILGNTISDTKKQSTKKLLAEPRFAFTWLPGAHSGNFDKFKIVITADGVTYEPKFTNSGIFTLVFPADVKVSVSIEIPVESVLSAGGTSGWKYEIVDGHTVVKYNLEKSNCICDYKKFEFMPY